MEENATNSQKVHDAAAVAPGGAHYNLLALKPPPIGYAAQKETLIAAAQTGVPFCEQCQKRGNEPPPVTPKPDHNAQRQALKSAAQSGVPFCESCQQ